ncbi:MAG TPA: hypothetical protein VMW80_04015 [Candidatus Dormibacteraeota bacterium]|nr:hypothetical protein [Candidatus Dormibacteraeota bacterium]
MSVATVLEPTATEQELAADFESVAQGRGLSLDVGESQLCAIVIERGVRFLITGDKRAVVSIDRLLDDEWRLEALKGRIRCLEQLVKHLLSDGPRFSGVREAICSEPAVDTALTMCFGCWGAGSTLGAVIEALDSYIRDLRSRAARVLCP